MSESAEKLVEQAREARRYGDGEGALMLYRQAGSAYGDDLAGRAHCLRHIADLLRESGKPGEARSVVLEAQALYEAQVEDTLSLANTVRLLALLDGDTAQWRKARVLYERAAEETGFDLQPAFDECDRNS